MITVLGSTNLDQIGRVSRLPSPGETVSGSAFSIAAGGKGANQALAARRAGSIVRHFSAVGRDAFADAALELLRADGVELSGLRVVNGPTGIAMILVDDSGENVIAILPGANASVAPDDAERALAGLQAGAVVMLQQEVSQGATLRALEIAEARGLVTILNTAPFLTDTVALAQRASIVVANETEFALLCGGDTGELEAAMSQWARDHGRTLIVTLGADGVRAATPERVMQAPALPITPVDTVGAGDTFCGYLAAGLDQGLDLQAAITRAAVAGSLACLKPGAQPAIPYKAEVDAALSRGSR